MEVSGESSIILNFSVDDTQMGLATLRSLRRNNGLVPADLARE